MRKTSGNQEKLLGYQYRKMNVYAIIQSSTNTEKEIVFKFLIDYFGYVQDDSGNIHKLKGNKTG